MILGAVVIFLGMACVISEIGEPRISLLGIALLVWGVFAYRSAKQDEEYYRDRGEQWEWQKKR